MPPMMPNGANGAPRPNGFGAPPMGMMPPMNPQPSGGTPISEGGQGAPEKPDEATEEMIARANGPNWDDVMQILRSDRMRGYRIDVETDATVLEDAVQEKQSRIEFLQAFEAMLEKVYQAATMAPAMLPLMKEMLVFGVKTFKAGRSMEQIIEDMFDELQKNPPEPPPDSKPSGPDPQVAIEEAKAKAAAEMQRLAQEDKHKTASLAIDGKKAEDDAAHKQSLVAIEGAKAKTDADFKAQSLEIERQKAADAAAAKNAELAHSRSVARGDMHFKAAQANRELIDENMLDETGDGETGGAAPEAGPSPFAGLLSQLGALTAAMAQGQQQLAQTQAAAVTAQEKTMMAVVQNMARQSQEIEALISQMNAPKRVVRGADGRAVGIETVRG